VIIEAKANFGSCEKQEKICNFYYAEISSKMPMLNVDEHDDIPYFLCW